MTDFLDRYGDQLRAAKLPRRRRWRTGAIAGLATLAVAAPVVAITAPDRAPTLTASGLPDTYKLVREGDQLCLDGPGSRLACLPEADAAEHGLTIIGGRGDSLRYAGVVPDTVARVRYVPQTGLAVETPVTGNFYTFVIDLEHTHVPHLVPPLTTGPAANVPGIGKLEWLDARGAVIPRPPMYVRAR